MGDIDLDLILKVCNLKYKEKKQQNEISRILKLSPAKVTRILQKAIDLEILQFNIINKQELSTEIESSLEHRFKLKRVIVVKNEKDAPTEIKELLGQKVASYLINILKDSDVLGISHSSTVKKVIEALPMKLSKKVEVVQLLGGSYLLTFEGLDQTKELSNKFGVSPHILYAPLFVDNREIKEAILKDSSMKQTFDFFNNVNIAIVGAGTFYPLGNSTIFRSGFLTGQEIKELSEAKVAGDIFGHFFDNNGSFCNTSVEQRIIAIPVECIPKIEYRIGVAGGTEKYSAILGALKGKIINILATDEKTANMLLNS